MSDRERIIETLLVWYRDVEEGIGASGPGAGDGVIGMSAAWNHPSYRQLRRLLLELRASEPGLHWALMERYVRCVTTTRSVMLRGGRWVTPANWFVYGAEGRGKSRQPTGFYRRLVTSWDAGVSAGDVAAGLGWLAGRWPARVPLCVPDELLTGKAA